MRLYRVEDDEKTGAYSMRDIEGNNVISSKECDQHPMPLNDPALRDIIEENAYNWFFAFESLEHLRAWFMEDLCEPLRAAGAAISVIEVQRYALGEKQAIFHADEKVLIERIPL